MSDRTLMPTRSVARRSPMTDMDLFWRVFARAHRYWRRWDEALWRYHELSAVTELFRQRPALLSGPVLDLGCGDGEVFDLVFERRPDAFGIDSGATRGDDLSKARGRGTYAEVRQCDAAHLPFADQTFRLVFSNSVLEHISPVGPVLNEVYRVLGPGGCFVFTTPDPSMYSARFHYWRATLSRIRLDRLADVLVARECRAYHHVSILPFSTWKSEAERAGFAEVERRGYLPARAARAISRFGALTRVAGLRYVAWMMSREGRVLSRPSNVGADEWIDRCGEMLEPFVRESVGECGQLIIATKAGPRAPKVQ